MNLWILDKTEAAEDLHEYGQCGLVVRAETESEARSLAHLEDSAPIPDDLWSNPDYSTCNQISIEGKPGILLTDYRC